MTFEDICSRLKAAGIPDYRYEARVLLSEICGCESEYEDIDSPELCAAVDIRCKRYPLQYILGKWWFGDCTFKVSENCLIPRADTETVVEQALKILPQAARIADLCAGSGCIGILILHMRRDIHCDAVELYPKTLELARENADLNGVSDRYTPILGNVLLGEGLTGDYDAIISNPPYIRRDVLPTLSEEVMCEPVAALDGGEDGMIFYRDIVARYRKHLAKGGVFVFEIGYDQAEQICSVASENGMSCRIVKDLGGNDRVAVLS